MSVEKTRIAVNKPNRKKVGLLVLLWMLDQLIWVQDQDFLDVKDNELDQ